MNSLKELVITILLTVLVIYSFIIVLLFKSCERRLKNEEIKNQSRDLDADNSGDDM